MSLAFPYHINSYTLLGSPTRFTSGTLNFNPPLLIKERDAIGLYVAEPQGDDRIVSFVGDGSDSLCLSAISAGTIDCSSTAIVSEKLLRAHGTISEYTDVYKFVPCAIVH